jgi:hypothetical protein
MSVFQSVLERLKTEEDDEQIASEDADVAAPRLAPFAPAFAVDGVAAAAFGTVERAYFDAAFVEPPPPPVMPDHLKRTSLAEVAEELALTDNESPATLAAKRRTFAADNHPDRLPQDFRVNATVRMKLANMLIDEAARQIRTPGAQP